MAFARLVLKNLEQTACSASLLSRNATPISPVQKQRWASQLLRRLSSAAEEKPDATRDLAVAEGGKKSKLLSRRRSRRGGLWRSNNRDFVPAIWEFFPSGLGNALIQATENINRVIENLSPSQLLGRAREHDDCYKLRYDVPEVGKDDVKTTVEDGVLKIRGEHKEEEEGSDEEHWAARSYGYYNASVLLPDDAKVDEIKAEIKDGLLNIVIPKSEKAKKNVKEIQVQ